jgi:hypothetical protein
VFTARQFGPDWLGSFLAACQRILEITLIVRVNFWAALACDLCSGAQVLESSGSLEAGHESGEKNIGRNQDDPFSGT